MRKFYGYIRVSTVKQGQQGVSLQEQRDAILRYAQRTGIEISTWFEEQVTAAKQGRPEFNRMLKLLRSGKAAGVVLHKIDRGARNLSDWSRIAELNDEGIEVHFANDGLDLKSRGGRLSADIQAVVATDYIRNLREETIKGFYGRLKQGILPLPAPIGYLNNGAGKVKTPDPIMAPRVRQAFELYATGAYSLDTLGPELYTLGLRNKHGREVSRAGLAGILGNPFYAGLIYIARRGEVFKGGHEPLITQDLFNRVKDIREGKTNNRLQNHAFTYRRMIECKKCGRNLTGEKQKGRHYYRCHNRECHGTGLREDVIDEALLTVTDPWRFSQAEIAAFRDLSEEWKMDINKTETEQRVALQLKLGQITNRLDLLTDAMLDGTVDKATYVRRHNALVAEQSQTECDLKNLTKNVNSLPDRATEMFELASTAWDICRMGKSEEKRELVKIMCSNLQVEGKSLYVTTVSPFAELQKECGNTNGGPKRDIRRMWKIISQALESPKNTATPGDEIHPLVFEKPRNRIDRAP